MLQFRISQGAGGRYRFGLYDEVQGKYIMWSTDIRGDATPGAAAQAARELALRLYVDRPEVYTDDGYIWSE